MIRKFLLRKQKEYIADQKRKSWNRGHTAGCRKAGLEFKQITKDAEKKHKKELEYIRHKMALQLQRDERFFAEVNNEILKMMA